ncbi:hypothetical protein [Actinomadura rifamycini]|uniref:hypothetical protein n=1 Tax=Actinomadura rifamycini TaxID=31962 RepID=UPI0003F862F0|nr:hypothetical protein [Actinomadura rifamycini]
MQSNAKIAVALVGGYLLGRTKKAKMAIGLGMFLAGKKISLDPRELSRLAAASPLVSGLSDQVRKDLVDGTRTALTSAVTQRANTLADTLHERTLDLGDPLGRGGRDGGGAEPDTAREDTDAGADAPEGDTPEGNADDGKRRGGARKAAPAKASKAAEPAARRPAGKAASAGRSAGRSTARKTAGTARKAASGGRRKAADRAGDADG